MSQDIIFHIGFPKTATTYLQRRVFRSMNALGNDSVVPGATKLEARLQNIVSETHAGFWRSRAGRRWGDALISLVDGDNTVLYSSEYFLRGPYHFYVKSRKPAIPEKSSHLAVEHLTALQETIWRERGSVKVVFTVRAQGPWMASRFAQLSDEYADTGQRHFERVVQETLADNSAAGWQFLDYALLYSQLTDALGSENVAVLFFEDLGTPAFVSRLAEWMPGLGEIVDGDDAAINVWREGESTWRLRPPSYWNRFFPLRALNFVTTRLFGFESYKLAYKAMGKPMDRGTIELLPAIERQIKSVYSDSNNALAEATGYDLMSQGYL